MTESAANGGDVYSDSEDAALSTSVRGIIRKLPMDTSLKLFTSATLKGIFSLFPAGGAFVEAINLAEAREAERQLLVLKYTIEQLQTDIEGLSEKLRDDDELADLFQCAMTTARTASTHQKLTAFANILAGCIDANHNDRILASAQIRIIDSLHEEHVQVLAAVRNSTKNKPPENSDGSTGHPGLELSDLQEYLPHLATISVLLIQSLETMGLITNSHRLTWAGVSGAQAFVLTDLGERLLDTLGRGEMPCDTSTKS